MCRMNRGVLVSFLFCMSLRGVSVASTDATASSKRVETDGGSCPSQEMAPTPTHAERLLGGIRSGKCALCVIAFWLLLSYACVWNSEDELKRAWLKDRLFKDLMQNILVLLEFMEEHDYDSGVSPFLLLVVFAYFVSVLGEIYRLAQIARTWSTDDIDDDPVIETYDNLQFGLGCVLALADVISGNIGKSPTLLAKCSFDAFDFLDKKREAEETKQLEADLKVLEADCNNLKHNEDIFLAIKRPDKKFPDVEDMVEMLNATDASGLAARLLCDIKRKRKQTCASVVRDMDPHKAKAALAEMNVKDAADILESLGKTPTRNILKAFYDTGSTDILADIWVVLKKRSVLAADAIFAKDPNPPESEHRIIDRDEAIEKARNWYLDPHCLLDDGLQPSQHICSSLPKSAMQEIANAEVEMIKLRLKDELNRVNGWINLGAKETSGYCFRYGHEPVSYIKQKGYWCTILHYAVHHAAKAHKDKERLEDHLKIIGLLLRKGANPALRDGWGHDVFELATKIQNTEERSEVKVSKELFANEPEVAKILDFINNQSPIVNLAEDEEIWEKIKEVLESRPSRPSTKARNRSKSVE